MNRYQEHIFRIAHEHQVRVIEEPLLPPEGAAAVVQIRTIVVSPIIDETLYAIALHELGHVIAPNGHNPNRDHSRRLKDEMALMDEEDAAWAWAMQTAMEWTPVMESVHQYARESYRKSVVEAAKAILPPLKPRPKLSNWR